MTHGHRVAIATFTLFGVVTWTHLGAQSSEKAQAPTAAQAPPVSTAAAPVAPAKFALDATDVAQQHVVIPDPKRVTLLLFVMVGPERNKEALRDAMEVIKHQPDVSAVAVVSGENAAIKAKQVAELAGWPHAILLDPDYKLASTARVRAWPTTLVIDATGRIVAHIGGLTTTYRRDLGPQIDFAAGRINHDKLEELLTARETVPDKHSDVGERHLSVAMRLSDRGLYAEASQETKRVLELLPDDPRAQLLMARIEVRLGRAQDALDRLRDIKASQTAPWQMESVRGLALAALGRWAEAREALSKAVTLNPEPAECYYYLGRACEQVSDWPAAAAAFRASYESSHVSQTSPASAETGTRQPK